MRGGVRKRPVVRYRPSKRVIKCGKKTMGDSKNKRGKASDSSGGSPARKKGPVAGKSTDAESERDKGGAMECGEARGGSETNNNVGMKRRERDGIKTTSTSKALAESMECGERSAEEDSSGRASK